MFARLRPLLAWPRRSGGPAGQHRKLDARTRILGWATLAAFIIGLLGLGQPIEDYYRMVRNMLRLHPPSGEVVVVGIDDRSVSQLGDWPWRRSVHARLIERLNGAGAHGIFFDIPFLSNTNPIDDQAFEQAIERAGNVHLFATQAVDPSTGELRAKLPNPRFARHAKLFSAYVRYSGLGAVQSLPYATELNGRVVPTMATVIANSPGRPNASFRVDYAVDTRRIPTISAVDVLQSPKLSSLKGKSVIVAFASPSLGDIFYQPGRGLINGAYIQAAGAETLKSGHPIDLGWFWALACGVVLSFTHVYARQRYLGRLALVVAIGGVTVLPLLAESNLIFIDVVPAAVLVGAVAGSWAWSKFRRSYKVRGAINAISGLPNLNALRDESIDRDAVLVATRVRNFAEINSTLPPDSERELVAQIVARLALGSRGARIYQGDEGIFMWVASADTAGADQLDAMHALFRSPALVDGRPIDLTVTFGVDGDGGRSLANRIGATLVAADEAAAEGVRWKAFDPAKLQDAEWKLSLLGRLDAAIDTGEVWVAYQPQLDLATGRIVGAEALVRWSHPEKGEVSPQEFVLAAEQHDRIDKLTEFVLSDAIKASAGFAARGIDLNVAVNISARLLERPGLVDLVRQLLADARLSSDRLTLEVTESAAMASGRTSIRTLEELGSLGICVSIDDYGTGFSTLDYFKKIPAAEVKIDKSFVGALDRNASDRVMVRSTIELAHSLGRTVVAEGVETSEILSELTRLGCDRAQGYLIGRPMKLIALTKMLLDDRKTRAA